MSGKTQFKYIAESAAFIAAAVCLNVLVNPEDPGFADILFSPYITAALLPAVLYGRRYGFLNLLMAAAAVAVMRTLNSTISGLIFNKYEPFIAAAAILLIYIFGTIRRLDQLKLNSTREHLKSLSKELYRAQKITSAQLEVNRELEERVTRQRATITTLYNQMHKMDSLNLGKSLDIFLETVQLFTDATAITIWTQSQTSGFLHSPAALHQNADFDSSTLLNIDDSIEGWVFRNNRIVSARMINNYENLKKMDAGRNLITLPIPLNKQVWGVLNIEEMPFVKYNQHTERLLEIIINLAEPTLARAFEHEKQVLQSETDADTNLPLFSQLFNSLNRFIKSTTDTKARISLLVIEMQNFDALSSEFPVGELKKLFLRLTDEILLATAGLAEFFMYKSDNQMAVLIPGIDGDGASLLCLEILELVNSTEWRINESAVHPEIIIGYSTLGENAPDASGLTKHAEHLLAIQKI